MSSFTRTLALTATAGLVAGLFAAGPVATAPTPAAATWHGTVRGDLTPTSVDVDGLDGFALARVALAEQATILDVDADAFHFDHVTTSALGFHVRGAEYRGGVAVTGTSAAVHVIDGRVWQVEARGSSLAGTAALTAVTAEHARRTGLASLGVETDGQTTWVDVDRRLTPMGDTLVDTWRVHVTSLAGIAATVLVAAEDGAVLAVEDQRQFADGTAMVFDPNPVVHHQDSSLRQPGFDIGGVDSDLPDDHLNAARVPLAVLDVDVPALARARIVGPWVDVRAPAPLSAGAEASPNFDFGREDPRFEAAMSYAHIDRAQRYFQDVLGLTGVNDESQLVIAIPVQGFDNSFYQPGNDLMLLGSGGVDDGEDAEVILHEYGHAIHDAQVPGWGKHAEGGAMGEGFGDFLAAAFYARTSSKGFQDACIADWDATSYSNDDPPCLRRTDSAKHWPEDRRGAVHDDGEVWSQFLWNIRARLADGRGLAAEQARSDRALRLLLTSHTFLTPTATFNDAATALDTAAFALGDAKASRIVREEAARIGFEVE